MLSPGQLHGKMPNKEVVCPMGAFCASNPPAEVRFAQQMLITTKIVLQIKCRQGIADALYNVLMINVILLLKENPGSLTVSILSACTCDRWDSPGDFAERNSLFDLYLTYHFVIMQNQ
jgi:hypothetical protein